MIGLLQRVTQARVDVAGESVGEITAGLLVLLAVEPTDTAAEADRLADRLVRYRVFADEAGRMNLSLLDTGGSLLLVPQFTLAADTGKGLRPSFTGAAPPGPGEALFERTAQSARALLGQQRVATGRFGAHMQVSLTNDGPVTFWLQCTANPATGPQA
jgi:D-tyrosyl-tRNA(Tyr) deacylase